MREAAGISLASRAGRKAIVPGLAMLAVGIFVATAALVITPRHGNALPAYGQKEGKACGYCHKNPAGGGERNATGKKYEANGHTFKK